MSWSKGWPIALVLLGSQAAGRAWTQEVPAQPQSAPATTTDVQGLRRRSDPVKVLQASVRLVTLDVVVTDSKGHTVRGLQPSDFTLREDGQPQKVKVFEEHAQPNPDDAALALARARLPRNTFSDAASPIAESSAIVLLLDALDTPAISDQMLLRSEMIKYMKTVPAGTRIAIVQLDTQLHLLQNFSSDPDELLLAVKGKRDTPKLSTLPHPYFGGRPFGAGSGAEIAALDESRTQSISQQITNDRRSQIMAQIMPQLMNFMGGIPGRKSVAWFYSQAAPSGAYAESLQTMLRTDETSFIDDISNTTAVLKTSHIALYMVNVAGVGHLLPENESMKDAARAAGGDAFYNTNDIASVLARVADSAWNYYTLAYTPRNSIFDGGFRKLQVELSRQGLRLQYRNGYYAANDSVKQAQHALEVRAAADHSGAASAAISPGGNGIIDTAMLMGAPSPHDVLFTAHVDPSGDASKLEKNRPPPTNNFLAAKYRKDKYRDYQISYNVDPHTLKLLRGPDQSYQGGVDLVAVVYDDQGNTVNSIISKASIHATARIYPALEAKGIEVEQTIAIPAKGSFFLRLGVHDRAADKAGSLEVPVDAIKLDADSR